MCLHWLVLNGNTFADIIRQNKGILPCSSCCRATFHFHQRPVRDYIRITEVTIGPCVNHLPENGGDNQLSFTCDFFLALFHCLPWRRDPSCRSPVYCLRYFLYDVVDHDLDAADSRRKITRPLIMRRNVCSFLFSGCVCSLSFFVAFELCMFCFRYQL